MFIMGSVVATCHQTKLLQYIYWLYSLCWTFYLLYNCKFVTFLSPSPILPILHIQLAIIIFSVFVSLFLVWFSFFCPLDLFVFQVIYRSEIIQCLSFSNLLNLYIFLVNFQNFCIASCDS